MLAVIQWMRIIILIEENPGMRASMGWSMRIAREFIRSNIESQKAILRFESLECRVTPSVDLSVSLSAPASGQVASGLYYQFNVFNGDSSDATNVRFTTILPTEFAKYIYVDVTRGTFTNSAGVIDNEIGTLQPGTSATILFRLDPIKKGVINLSGSITSADDPNTANDASSGNITIAPYPAFIVAGPGSGGGPLARVFSDNIAHQVIRSYMPFGPDWKSSINVAQGDLNGDGVPEVIFGAGPGGAPRVIVYDLGGSVLASFYAYDSSFRDGVYVASADVDGENVDIDGDGYGDSKDDIITGAGGGGGPHVKVFQGWSYKEIRSFFAYDAGFTGGVRVAGGDLNHDGFADIITGAGGGGSAHVKAFNGTNLTQMYSFFAYDSGLRDGVFVAAGDMNGDGFTDIVTGAGGGGSSHVKSFNGTNLATMNSFFAFSPDARDGVSVATNDSDNDNIDEFVTGTGVSFSTGVVAQIKTFYGTNNLEQSFFTPGFSSGVFVG